MTTEEKEENDEYIAELKEEIAELKEEVNQLEHDKNDYLDALRDIEKTAKYHT